MRSLSPEETLNVLKQEEEDRTRAKEANGSASLSLWALEWVAGGGGDNGGGGPGAGPPSRKLPGFTPATSPSGALAAMPLSMMASLAKSKSSKLVIDEEEEEEDVPIEPEEDESEEEDEEYCHPLSNVQGMPSFSDLQGSWSTSLPASFPAHALCACLSARSLCPCPAFHGGGRARSKLHTEPTRWPHLLQKKRPTQRSVFSPPIGCRL